MKTLVGAIALAMCLLLISASDSLGSKAQPKMVQFHMALLKKGPKWTEAETPETKQILQQHLAHVLSLLDSGKAIIAGPVGARAISPAFTSCVRARLRRQKPGSMPIRL